MLRPGSLLLPLALGLAGCSSSSTKPPTSTSGTNGVPPGGSSGGGGDGGTATSSCTFPASPTPFALPVLNNVPASPFPQLTDSSSCATGTSKLTYSLLDMNADGEPDLVLTSTCDNSAVGVTEWLVYLNVETGFSPTPIDWALAPAPPTASCVKSFVFDIDGDLIPDYVETSLCTDATVGTSRWVVYPGIKNTGFSQTSASYALPPGYSAGAFTATSAATQSCTGGQNLPVFDLFDINGDLFVDFVMTQSCTDPTVGTTGWQVYLGGEPGASQVSTTFALPTAPTVTTGAFASTSGTLACSTSVTKPTFALLDFDLNGKPDIVVTQDCVDVSVGTDSWLLYPNSGTSFAASPTTIALPSIPGVPAGSFTSLGGNAKCSNGSGAPAFTLVDLTGDTVIDFLVTQDCGDALTGVSYWQVFPNVGGAGFTSPVSKLMLPPSLNATSAAPAGLSGALDCTPPVRPAYTATYLAGLAFDLVVTGACADSTVGDTQWLLFPASCK